MSLFIILHRAACADVVAEAFEEGAFFAAAFGQFNQRLNQAAEQLVAAEAVVVEVLIDFMDIACSPEVHEPVNAVDQRDGLAAGRIIAHVLAFTL